MFVPDRYIPSSDVCGQRFERCSTATLTNRNRTISLIPLNDSVGLILHNRDNTDGDLLQHILSPENLEGCMFINFVPVIAAIQRNEAVGYCVKSEILHTFDIIVNFESLHLSRIQPRIIGDMYSLGTSAKITNFVYFDNHPGDSCFSTELPYNFFLVNNTLIEHSFGDGFMAIGTIGSSATCTNLQRIGECELATYCGREVFTVSIRDSDRDNFTPAPVPLTADGGFVFLCSSSYLVYITNSTLILYDRSTLSLLGEPFYAQFDAEDIMQGDCQGSETGSTAFVVTLQGTNSSVFLYRIILMQQDSSTTRVNVTDLTSTYLNNNNSEGMGSDMITAQTGTQYAIVSNGTDTFIYNWTLSCDERPLIIQSVLTFISFYTTDSTYQCRCPIPESPVMTTNSVTTTTPTTASSTTRTNPTTSSLTTTSSPSTSPGSENFQNLVIGSYILTILLFVIVLIIIGICAYKK